MGDKRMPTWQAHDDLRAIGRAADLALQMLESLPDTLTGYVVVNSVQVGSVSLKWEYPGIRRSLRMQVDSRGQVAIVMACDYFSNGDIHNIVGCHELWRIVEFARWFMEGMPK